MLPKYFFVLTVLIVFVFFPFLQSTLARPTVGTNPRHDGVGTSHFVWFGVMLIVIVFAALVFWLSYDPKYRQAYNALREDYVKAYTQAPAAAPSSSQEV